MDKRKATKPDIIIFEGIDATGKTSMINFISAITNYKLYPTRMLWNNEKFDDSTKCNVLHCCNYTILRTIEAFNIKRVIFDRFLATEKLYNLYFRNQDTNITDSLELLKKLKYIVIYMRSNDIDKNVKYMKEVKKFDDAAISKILEIDSKFEEFFKANDLSYVTIINEYISITDAHSKLRSALLTKNFKLK